MRSLVVNDLKDVGKRLMALTCVPRGRRTGDELRALEKIVSSAVKRLSEPDTSFAYAGYVLESEGIPIGHLLRREGGLVFYRRTDGDEAD